MRPYSSPQQPHSESTKSVRLVIYSSPSVPPNRTNRDIAVRPPANARRRIPAPLRAGSTRRPRRATATRRGASRAAAVWFRAPCAVSVPSSRTAVSTHTERSRRSARAVETSGCFSGSELHRLGEGGVSSEQHACSALIARGPKMSTKAWPRVRHRASSVISAIGAPFVPKSRQISRAFHRNRPCFGRRRLELCLAGREDGRSRAVWRGVGRRSRRVPSGPIETATAPRAPKAEPRRDSLHGTLRPKRGRLFGRGRGCRGERRRSAAHPPASLRSAPGTV